MKVYPANFLNTDHWSAIIQNIGRNAIAEPLELDSSQFCLRVLELTWGDNGVVLGNPSAPRKLTVARENQNHFVPVLSCLDVVSAASLLPW